MKFFITPVARAAIPRITIKVGRLKPGPVEQKCFCSTIKATVLHETLKLS